MNPSDKTPSEIIDHIADIIKERDSRKLPTFFTICIEQFDKMTPVIEKETGYENFKKQVQKYITDYELTGLLFQLFSGKSRSVRTPFQTFKVALKKQQAPTVVLGGSEAEAPQVQQLDSAIPVGRYYDEKFEYQLRIMRSEMEKQGLMDKLNHVTERYEEKLKDMEARHADKLAAFAGEIDELEGEVEELQREIFKNEKEKHGSLGNITLGGIGARAIEGFAKSELGAGVLKGLLGSNGYTSLQGTLTGAGDTEAKENTATPPSPGARIITAPVSDPRQNALNFIQTVGQSLPDSHLRMLYDICLLSQKNIGDLQILWNVAQQISTQRKEAANAQAQTQAPAMKNDSKEQAQQSTVGSPNDDTEDEEDTEEETDDTEDTTNID